MHSDNIPTPDQVLDLASTGPWPTPVAEEALGASANHWRLLDRDCEQVLAMVGKGDPLHAERDCLNACLMSSAQSMYATLLRLPAAATRLPP